MLDPELVRRVHERLVLPDGSVPMMEKAGHINYYLDGRPIYCSPKKPTKSCDMCRGTGLVPKPADALAVLEVMSQIGWDRLELDRGLSPNRSPNRRWHAALFNSGGSSAISRHGTTSSEAIYRAVAEALGRKPSISQATIEDGWAEP